jgi:hypothetical protein
MNEVERLCNQEYRNRWSSNMKSKLIRIVMLMSVVALVASLAFPAVVQAQGGLLKFR